MSNSEIKRTRGQWIAFCQKWAAFLEQHGYGDLAAQASDGAALVRTGKPAQVKPMIEQWLGWLSVHALTISDDPVLVFDNADGSFSLQGQLI